ncbi:MAG: thiol peroxidase [Candidatus Omnitrophica bacterium]|nr:thiol peroxidase [Candidatus Omnitrophota bacterium]
MSNIKFKGETVHLVGRKIEVGKQASPAYVVTNDLREIDILELKGRIKLITTFPSLDTPVCDLQVKEFNKKAVDFSDEVIVLGISKDLPFAQKRFCESFSIDRVILLSDYKSSSFGINYGFLIKELGLLARGVMILDKNDFIRYIQIVEELTLPPDYNDALSNLEKVIKSPYLDTKKDLPTKCKPCEEGIPPLTKETIDKLIAQYNGWQLIDDKKLVKEFIFKDFKEAKYFLDLIAIISEEQKHHPHISLIYNKLKLTLTTHASGGLTENDLILAKIIDELT